ncbi:PaeR7I family type II restriction endonuclease [Paraburkholderia sp. SIMBA_027]|uniref:PaeR7I family type II restriction endonuclease n=1 Tax=Paraburkholderia sp. SIMBA_027 TaxID=3085770 RepID=UPI00397C7420
MIARDVRDYDEDIKHAVRTFWTVRDGGKGVLAGKTLHEFLEIIKKVVKENGLPDAEIYTGKNTSQLPGFFRPHKCWDAVVINHGELVAAIEFKSQVGSIGNNFNNRTEEVLGSAIDLKNAVEEDAFGDDANIFTGYIIVVEKSASTDVTPKIQMKFFPVMQGFLLDETKRDTEYQKGKDGGYPSLRGISYLHRYDVMCKRLMLKKLYSAASLVAVPNQDHHLGSYEHVSAETSIVTFLAKLAAHCQVAARINEQRK